MTTLVLQGNTLTTTDAEKIASSVQGSLETRTGHYAIQCQQAPSAALIAQLRTEYLFDINVLPETFDPSQVKLLVTDMDSTLINIECVDEIADFINVKAEVSAITEAAMRGEIDFPSSLRQRVVLLKGLNDSALQHVYDERLKLNPGAGEMVAGLHNNGIKVALVSGGFTFFTERLKERLKLDYTLANTLAITNNVLTGEVQGDIVGAEAKADYLLTLCKTLEIKPSQTIAMGDGANDLVMMKAAGLGIAYHAKPKVQEQAHTALNHCGLEGVLGLLNIPTQGRAHTA